MKLRSVRDLVSLGKAVVVNAKCSWNSRGKMINSRICVSERSMRLGSGARAEEGRQCGLTVTLVRDGGSLAQDGSSVDGDVFPL